MDRIITVKGIGTIKAKPDLVIITMNLESHMFEYDQTMELAAKSVNTITSAIESVGFDKIDLKTSHFNIRPHYEQYTDENNNYKNKFNGYICEQSLKLAFDLDTKIMSDVLNAVAKTEANPGLDIQFSIKNETAISEKLIVQATKNAKKKAEVLAKAAGVALEDLVSIDYDWSELQLYSSTNYDLSDHHLLREARVPEIHPEEINVKDTATLIWTIK